MVEPTQIVLTDSQLEQLAGYQPENGEGRTVLLRPAQNPGSGYVDRASRSFANPATPKKLSLGG
jgi:hypothetical protein